MDKNTFDTILKNTPETLTEEQFQKLNNFIAEHPYFSLGRTLLAKAAFHTNAKDKKNYITSAALHNIDRKQLKKFVLEVSNTPLLIKSHKVDKNFNLDVVISELNDDLEQLRKSREAFLNLQSKIIEDDAINFSLNNLNKNNKEDEKKKIKLTSIEEEKKN